MRVLIVVCVLVLAASVVDARPAKHVIVHGHQGVIPFPHTAAQAKAYPALKTPTGLQHYVPKTHGRASIQAGVPASDAPELAYFETSGGYLQSTADRLDAMWGQNLVVASSATLHFNTGQPAKVADPLDNAWQAPFPLPAPITALDGIYFCGGQASSHVQVYDANLDAFLFDGTLSGIPACP